MGQYDEALAKALERKEGIVESGRDLDSVFAARHCRYSREKQMEQQEAKRSARTESLKKSLSGSKSDKGGDSDQVGEIERLRAEIDTLKAQLEAEQKKSAYLLQLIKSRQKQPKTPDEKAHSEAQEIARAIGKGIIGILDMISVPGDDAESRRQTLKLIRKRKAEMKGEKDPAHIVGL